MRKVSQDSNLDILRSVAVLAVFLTHALQVIAGCKIGERLAFGVETYALGRAGVLLFFVHTSLVLMQSLERSGRELADWPLVRYFYLRRVFRIYPLSICLILLSIACSLPPNALGIPYKWYGAKWLMANLLLIQNIANTPTVSSPLWSLPYEVQMYLVLPFLFLALRTPRSGSRLIAIYAIGALLSLIYPLFLYMPCFLAGVIAYKALATVPPRVPAWLWFPAVAGAAIAYVSTRYTDASWLKDGILCLSIGVSIPLFHRTGGSIATAASHIAKYSYGIYLCHTPILWLCYRKLTMPDWQRAVCAVIATGIVSVACYHAIEHPLIRIGTRLANRVSVKPAMPVGAAAATT